MRRKRIFAFVLMLAMLLTAVPFAHADDKCTCAEPGKCACTCKCGCEDREHLWGDWVVKYDFDDENITEGDYQVTFSTQGRELKVETTKHIEEGERIGLTWEPGDVHVMRKMGA